MIFFSYGTEKFNFDRMNSIIDLFIKNNEESREKIILQYGFARKSKLYENIKSFDFCNQDVFIKYIMNSDILVTHGGVGTVFTGLKYNKRILAIARLKEFNEHVDNHQLEIISELEQEGFIKSFNDYDTFVKALESIQNSKLKRYLPIDNCGISQFINSNYLDPK